MKNFSSFIFFYLFPALLSAQVLGPVDNNFNSIRQNGVSTIATYGDTVWISPSLNRNIGNAAEWFTPENADSVVNGVGRVFSYALGQDTVIAGLGYSVESADGTVPAGLGYYMSISGGESWDFINFSLDEDPPSKCKSGSDDYVRPTSVEDYDRDCDIIFEYGGETYTRIRTTVSEQSPPYKTDFKGNVIFSAAWGSGLLRSIDFGETWEKIILPPFSASNLNPENSYSWPSQFSYFDEAQNSNETAVINRYDPRSDNNLLGFSVFIDSQDRVWFGSAGGVNVSHNALTAPTDSISWKHVRFKNSSDGLTGNWIISIEEDPVTERIWMTNWIASDENERNSIVYTDDEGETFRQRLIGEKINDIGFKDGFVFATGVNGLFISPDGGDTWIKSPPIKSPNTFIKSSAEYFSAAATTDRIWIGTSDGIASHICCETGQLFNNWEITRVDFPLSGGNVFAPNAKSVESYAYPNPFSASVYDVVRIKFEVNNQGNVQVRIFDFGMNLVREVENDSFSPGTYEAVWNGYDAKGRKVANAPYIYVIETEEEKISGKILVVD